MKTLFIRAILVLAMSLSIETTVGLVFHLAPIQYKSVVVFPETLAQASDIHAVEHAIPNPCQVNPRLPTCASPDGRIIAASQDNGTVVVREAPSGKWLATVYQPHGESTMRRIKRITPQEIVLGAFVEAVSISPNGKLLATQRTDEPIIVWNAQVGMKKRTFKWPPNRRVHNAWNIQFSKDRKFLFAIVSAYGSKDSLRNTLALWNIRSQKQLFYVHAPQEKYFKKASIGPNGRTISAVLGMRSAMSRPSSYDNEITQIWDIKTGLKRIQNR